MTTVRPEPSPAGERPGESGRESGRGFGGARPDRRRQILLTASAGLATVAAMAIPLLWVLSSRTSSASFADSEVLSANRLGAAVLDLEVVPDPDGATADVVGRALFSATNLAPGDRVSGQLAMTNVGDLPLRYALDAMADGGTLGEWLRFEAWAADGDCAPDQPAVPVVEDVQVGSVPVPLIELVRTDGVNVLAPGDSFVLCIGATLPLDTPNEAQGQSLNLTVLVTAEQVVGEGS